jgi:nucleotide-binding universal stress UspA family protein
MFKRLVIPLDGSDLANLALEPAKDLARRLDVPVHLVRAVDPTVFNRVGTTGMGFDYAAVDELLVEEEQDATKFIDAQVESLAGEGLTATGVVMRGYAAAAVIACIEEGDMIAMASHGRTGVRRWFLGSVAEEVLRRSPVPVLLIRLPNEDEAAG